MNSKLAQSCVSAIGAFSAIAIVTPLLISAPAEAETMSPKPAASSESSNSPAPVPEPSAESNTSTPIKVETEPNASQSQPPLVELEAPTTPSGTVQTPTLGTPASGTPASEAPASEMPSLETPASDMPASGVEAQPTSPTSGENSDRPTLNQYSSDKAPVLRMGSKGQAVSDVQAYLKQSGLYKGAVDGVFGASLKASVMQLQRQADINPTGIIDATTWEAMTRLPQS